MLPPQLHAHPDLPGYQFSVVSGTVLSDTVMVRARGPDTPPGVNPIAERYREFWLRQDDGTEARLFADADQVQLREGHRVTLVVAAAREDARYVVRAWNHDAPHCSGVVRSSVTSISYDFPGQTGCVNMPMIALWGGSLVLSTVGYLAGWIMGILAAGAFSGAVIALWFRRGDRDRRQHDRREAALLHHLAGIGRALSLPADGGDGPEVP